MFVGTGFVKLMDIPEFANHLGDFGIVPDGLVSAVAWLVSLTELMTGLGLMANVRGSLTAALILLILFTSVLTYGIVLGLDIDCGCLGPNLPIGLKMQLLVDASLVAWCGLVHLTRKQRKAKSESPPTVARGASTP